MLVDLDYILIAIFTNIRLCCASYIIIFRFIFTTLISNSKRVQYVEFVTLYTLLLYIYIVRV